VLAVSGNSPGLFGHMLWQETRIPLFKQSIDTRHRDRYSWNAPPRVGFGNGWVRRGAAELFEEVVRLHPPLLPVCSDTEPRGESAAGQAPPLAELCLHQGTVWTWNRPIYDHHDGGHLRIEMRGLPAGPTPRDMVASAAFAIGLAEGLRPVINDLLPAIPFAIAEYNFYRAAQHGLDARLVWPSPERQGFREQPVTRIIDALLPVAAEGLARIGADKAEQERYLPLIAQRVAQYRTGAVWQRERLRQLRGRMALQPALSHMLRDYMALSRENNPVTEWPL